jgi:hypothetical protein
MKTHRQHPRSARPNNAHNAKSTVTTVLQQKSIKHLAHLQKHHTVKFLTVLHNTLLVVQNPKNQVIQTA